MTSPATRKASLGVVSTAAVLAMILFVTVSANSQRNITIPRDNIFIGHPSANSTCFVNYLEKAAQDQQLTLYLTQRELLACLRNTSMDPKIAFNLAEFTQYAWETYSIRLTKSTAAKNKYLNSLWALFVSDNVTDTPQFARPISEYDFHALLTQIFNSVDDLHQQFISAPMFRSTHNVVPVVFGTRLHSTTGNQIFTVTDTAKWWFSNVEGSASIFYSNHSSKYPGGLEAWNKVETEAISARNKSIADNDFHITAVNGIPAETYFKRLAENEAMTDINAAFNIKMRSNFLRTITRMSPYETQAHLQAFNQGNIFYAAPTAADDTNLDSTNLTFSDGSTLTYAKIVKVEISAGVSSCGPAKEQADATESGLDQTVSVVPVELIPDRPDPSLMQTPEADPIVKKSSRRREGSQLNTATQDKTMVIDGSGIEAHFIDDGVQPKTIVIHVTTFDTATLSSAMYNSYKANASLIAEYARQYNVQNLVIDVSDNGGGYLVLQMALLKSLFPLFRFEAELRQFPGVYNQTVNSYSLLNYNRQQGDALSFSIPLSRRAIDGTPLAGDTFANTSVRHASRYARALGRGYYDEFFNLTFNPETAIRHPLFLNTTDERFYINNSMPGFVSNNVSYASEVYTVPYFDLLYADEFPVNQSNPFTNISLLSNGFCGSACSMFTTRLRKYVSGVRAFSYGGFKSESVHQISLFCGGSVKRFSCPSNDKRWDPAPQSTFPFAGRVEMNETDLYANVDMTSNVFSYIDDAFTEPPNVAQPRQGKTNFASDVHLNVWEPTFDQKLRIMYPNLDLQGIKFPPPPPGSTTPSPNTSAPPPVPPTPKTPVPMPPTPQAPPGCANVPVPDLNSNFYVPSEDCTESDASIKACETQYLQCVGNATNCGGLNGCLRSRLVCLDNIPAPRELNSKSPCYALNESFVKAKLYLDMGGAYKNSVLQAACNFAACAYLRAAPKLNNSDWCGVEPDVCAAAPKPPAKFVLTFGGNWSALVRDRLEKIREALQKGLARLMNIPAHVIRILTVRTGSLVVEFAVLDPAIETDGVANTLLAAANDNGVLSAAFAELSDEVDLNTSITLETVAAGEGSSVTLPPTPVPEIPTGGPDTPIPASGASMASVFVAAVAAISVIMHF